ncbi:hypothetical protein Hanom_Chr00s007448g01737821 [Helianthus anomalus]
MRSSPSIQTAGKSSKTMTHGLHHRCRRVSGRRHELRQQSGWLFKSIVSRPNESD